MGGKGHRIGLDSDRNWHPLSVPGLLPTLPLWENVGNSSTTQAAPTKGEKRQSPPFSKEQKHFCRKVWCSVVLVWGQHEQGQRHSGPVPHADAQVSIQLAMTGTLGEPI